MFNVIIAFKDSERNWQFMFNDGEHAGKIVHDYEAGTALIPIKDDFGSSALIPLDSIAAILIEDLSKAIDAGVERGLFHMRGQAKTETKVRNDPLLKLAAARMNGGMPQRPF